MHIILWLTEKNWVRKMCSKSGLFLNHQNRPYVEKNTLPPSVLQVAVNNKIKDEIFFVECISVVDHYCTVSTDCSRHASQGVVNWTNMQFVTHHRDRWTLLKMMTKVQKKISAYAGWFVNNFFRVSRITLSCEHQVQWTMGVTHHKAWTIGRNGTVLQYYCNQNGQRGPSTFSSWSAFLKSQDKGVSTVALEPPHH